MFKIAVIIFRECLEMAVLLGIIMAITKPIKNSKAYIALGSGVGVVFAAIFAMLASLIADSFGGLGDEIFDAFVLLITTAIICWTVVWMQGYTTKLKRDLGDLSYQINAGTTSKIMLVMMVAMAVLREGAEIILFVYSISSSENIAVSEYVIAILLGGFVGFSLGAMIYLGLIKCTGKYIFSISTTLLILIAAGLSAQAAGMLTSSGIIEIYSDQVWDTSWFVENASVTGKVLNITVGYDSKPNSLQIIFYLTTIIITLAMMKLRSILSNKSNG
ncbi:MAG: hypothetical protein COA94_05715 [Rickettsiales bacterium]|nr:MAG: hypothetical protein COA94_05715 [Rickettsiales bacterium]